MRLTEDLLNNPNAMITTEVNEIFEEYTKFILDRQLNEALLIIYEIYDKGYSVMDILDNYFIFIKSTKMLNDEQKYNIVPSICKYITIFHNIHEDEIELSLFTNNLIQILSNNINTDNITDK